MTANLCTWKAHGVQHRPFDCWAPTESQLRASLAAAYGMVSMLDEAIGRILATLESTGLADKTIVIFTSNHGDMWGHHGLLLKHAVHYDACVRVPLFIRQPGQQPGVFSGLASSLDLAPTILAAAGLSPYHDLHGCDLSAVLNGDSIPVRDVVLIEEDEVFGLPGLPAPCRMRTLITEDARVTAYAGEGAIEIFDRVSDPSETNNLADTNSVLRCEMTERLLTTMIEFQDAGIAPCFSA